MLYETGTKFMFNSQVYILAQVDTNKFAMISLDDGNRYTDPIEGSAQPQSYLSCVTQEDVTKMFGGIPHWEVVHTNQCITSDKEEPFGYFRAGAFSWEDCADTDEGAKALYERPLVDDLRDVYNRIGEYLKDER